MNINRPLISILSTAFLLTSCESLPNVKISIEDNQTVAKAEVTEENEELKSESETTTPEAPQPTAKIPQNSPSENEPKAMTQSASGKELASINEKDE